MSASSAAVTVVIPTRNRWLMLRTALWCALNQDGVDVRVVVVDDGSSDETAERLASSAHGSITVVQAPRPGGVSAARNLGLERVETDLVAFLDDDDVWAPNHLAESVAAIDQGGADVAYSGSVTITLERTILNVRDTPTAEDLREALFVKNELLTPSSVLLRTDAVRAVQGFDTELAVTADWDLWLRLAPRARFAPSPVLSVGYTRHPHNMHLAVDTALRELPRLQEKHEAAMSARNRTFTDNCARWIAASYRESGRRGHALRWYLRAFRLERQSRDLGRAAGMLLGERVIERSGLKQRHTVQPGTAPWLEEIRRIDQLPADRLPLL